MSQEIEKSKYWDRYDPQWGKRWDEHTEEYDKYNAIETRNLSEEERNKIRESMKFHDEARKTAWVDKFKNAEEYGTYIINALYDGGNKKLVRLEQDLSTLKTAEDVHLAYKEASEFTNKQREFKNNAATIDRDHPLFKTETTKHWRTSIDYMQPSFFDGNLYTDTIVSLEKTPDKIRVCFTDISQNKGISAINNFEDAATIFYHQVLKKDVRQDQIEWYSHVDPMMGTRERLVPVTLQIDGQNRYNNARFERPVSETVPLSLQTAGFNCEPEHLILSPEIKEQAGENSIIKTAKAFRNAVHDFFNGDKPQQPLKLNGPK